MIFHWIWRHLPGPLAVKLVLATVVVLGLVALLMFVVFPWAEPKLPFDQVSVN